MTKQKQEQMQRHNIDTIAEVLIDKLGEMKSMASRIEKAAGRPLKIDSAELEKTLESEKMDRKVFLDELSGFREKNSVRVPNWVIGALCGMFLLSMASIWYAWGKAESYELQEAKEKYWMERYEALKEDCEKS